ncbi:uncharacterized protein [Argopecten irradians]|uniref:uncharacterized protein n=1 Tax=Argopecten irradians TaxID=31199 RepID=UPI00371A701E
MSNGTSKRWIEPEKPEVVAPKCEVAIATSAENFSEILRLLPSQTGDTHGATTRSSTSQGPKFINFGKAEVKGKSSVEGDGILATAADWEMRADIHQRMGFPEEVVSTPLRPDIVLWSRNSNQVIMVELTVPWEDRIEEAHERKRLKC